MGRTPDEVRKAKREHMARRRAANPDGVRAYQREIHHRNGDRNRAKMRDYARRRFFWNKAMHLRKEGRASYKELAALWHHQRGCCAITGRRLTRETAELDHILPKVRGGTDDIANLRWTCKEVNRAKRDLTDAEFVALLNDCMRWIGMRIAAVERIASSVKAGAA